jgi:putative transposase
LRQSGPEVIEIKTLDEVEKLVKFEPKNWVKTESGFDYVPAREAYQLQYGLPFRVVVITRKDHQVSENIRILLASRDAQTYDLEIGKKVDHLFEGRPLWRLDELSERLEQSDYTSVIQMIDAGFLSFEITSSSLASPEYCYVSKNKNLLIGLAKTEGRLSEADKIADESSPLDKTESPSSNVAEKILKRLERIESGEKSSSVRRWKKKISEGQQKGLSPFLALIDADRNISGRASKLSPEVKEFLDYFADNVRLSMRTESHLQVYYEYCLQAKEVHPNSDPVSTQTFYLRLQKIDPELVGQALGGKRMARAKAQPTAPRERHFTPQLPWLKTGVDHCKVKLSLIVYEDLENIYVQQPWLSVMFDIATGEVLAFVLSFENPSRQSCAKLFRDCVRRHGKLPREILFRYISVH